MNARISPLDLAYQSGFYSGKYGFSYLNPYYNEAELQAWQYGFIAGIRERENEQEETEEEE